MISATKRMVTLKFADLFRSEIDEARRLGYRLDAAPVEGAAIVRLVPVTQRTIALARANGADAVEATVPCDTIADMPDAMRTAIAAVVELARDAAA
jgi:hypothetical protein